ncbi:MAG: hypothetical protein K9M54_06975 [Kiritimatiellales bacterium]|nr:hypothetical protein [Kiritimatiellales bacterium]
MKTIKNLLDFALVTSIALTGISSAETTDRAKEIPNFTVDASRQLGPFQRLNGVNGGPRINLGTTFDNSEYFRAFNPPLVRTHDSAYSDLDTCDIHVIFPNFDADETDPKNYRFEKTDLYIKSILDVGARVIFRLGESIEPGTPKYYAHPPADFKKWARICCNIVRHYNMGWANGFEWNIQYWEIWNEPNNSSCWMGTMEQYCELYREAAVALKQLDPALKVGGPALAGCIGSKHGKQFLEFCRDNKLPLDFASWHGYSSKPDGLMKNIEDGIAALKEYGFENAESHFTEWNYGLGQSAKTREERRDHFYRMRGGPGAALAASMLAYMQGSELDVACFYSAFGTVFRTGFFDIYGVPSKQFYTFKAFHQLVQCGTRIETSGNNRKTGLGVVAAVNTETGTTAVLLSNLDDKSSKFKLELNHLPFKERLYCTEYVIDDNRALAQDREKTIGSGDVNLEVELPKGSVRLILFTPEPVKDEQ